jgi:hypothetical protein
MRSILNVILDVFTLMALVIATGREYGSVRSSRMSMAPSMGD